jgi:hypothetical protein
MDAYEWNARCIHRLLAQVLIKALDDLGRPSQRESALAFIASEYLDWIAGVLDISPDRIRQRVTEGIDPDMLRLLRYTNRAHKGKDGGVLAERARKINSAPRSLARQEAR